MITPCLILHLEDFFGVNSGVEKGFSPYFPMIKQQKYGRWTPWYTGEHPEKPQIKATTKRSAFLQNVKHRCGRAFEMPRHFQTKQLTNTRLSVCHGGFGGLFFFGGEG